MKKVMVMLLLFLGPNTTIAQDSESTSKSGRFELGARSTISLFENDGYSGFGAGGQFRICLGNKLNTEWYADYITTDIGGLRNRKTGHIG